MPTIAVDLDGVVFDFDRAWVDRRLQERPDLDLHPNMPQRWNELHLLGDFPDPGAFWGWWFQSGGFAGVPLIAGAREALWHLNARGWKVQYVTNRPIPDSVTLQELIRYRLPQPYDLIHTKAKWEIEAELFIEDAPHNLAMIGPWKALRVERPWNSPVDYPDMDGFISIPDLKTGYLAPYLQAVEADLMLA